MASNQLPASGGRPLSGRVAIVTGASSGLGQATARALVAAGAGVVLAARRRARLEQLRDELRSAGGRVLAVPTDVADYDQTAELVETTRREFGQVDILINAAGVMLPAPIERADPADWKRMIDVNLTGVLFACRATLPVMKKQGSGHIVNISSTSGFMHAPMFGVYNATKFGLGAFTEVLRREAYPDVRITLFAPGPAESELTEQIADEQVRQQIEEYVQGLHPLDADDVAGALVWVLTQPERIAVSEIVYRPTDHRDW